MSYQVIHMQKLKGTAIGGIEIHAERKREGVSHTNPDIDWTLTEANFHLQPPPRCTYAKAIENRLKELKISRVRKDAVKLCGFIISSDSDFFDGLTPKARKEFFEKAYNFFAKRYGQENIISAVVHMDEATPHMHLYLMPITSDGRLCCKDIFSRQELQNLHTAFHRDVSAAYGLNRGDGAAGKRRKHMSESEYKAYMDEVHKANQMTQEARENLQDVFLRQEGLKDFTARLRASMGNIEQTEKLVAELKPKKTLTGGVSGIRYRDVEQLIRAASESVEIKQRCVELLEWIEELREMPYESYRDESTEKIWELRNKIKHTEARLARYNRAINRLPPEVREQIIAPPTKQRKQRERSELERW